MLLLTYFEEVTVKFSDALKRDLRRNITMFVTDYIKIVLVIALFGLVVFINKVASHRILLMASTAPSHQLYTSSLAEALVIAGNDVGFVMASTQPETEVEQLRSKGIHVHKFRSKVANLALEQSILKQYMRASHEGDRGAFMDTIVNLMGQESQHVSSMMEDGEFLQKIINRKYQLVVCNNFYMSSSIFILPYKLGLPYVTITSHVQPWTERIPALPSFAPVSIITDYTQKMSFTERLRNAWYFFAMAALPERRIVSEEKTWIKYLPGVPVPSYYELRNKAILTLYNIEPLVRYPYPSMPNVIFVGGLSLRDVKPLSATFTAILDNSREDVILVSFGSCVAAMPEETITRLLNAFSKMPYTFLLKHPDRRNKSPANVKTFKWLPQNDLLAHPKVKLFISHCGQNSQMEGIFHAVPFICMPVIADQYSNAARTECHAYGRHLSAMYFSEEMLISAIQDVMNNATYRANVEQASRIFRDRPEIPRERAVYWIEHVIEFGGSHLRSYANEMPLYQYWMLDIMLFVSCVIIVAIFATIACVWCMLSSVKKTMRKYAEKAKFE